MVICLLILQYRNQYFLNLFLKDIFIISPSLGWYLFNQYFFNAHIIVAIDSIINNNERKIFNSSKNAWKISNDTSLTIKSSINFILIILSKIHTKPVNTAFPNVDTSTFQKLLYIDHMRHAMQKYIKYFISPLIFIILSILIKTMPVINITNMLPLKNPFNDVKMYSSLI